MLKGIYTAAAGMLATNTTVDTLASNLANVNTVGFKANRLSYQTFPEMMLVISRRSAISLFCARAFLSMISRPR